MGSVTFNQDAMALCMKLDSERRHIAETIQIGHDNFVDIDENGNVLGIELLLSKNTPDEVYKAIIRTKSIEKTA